MIPITGSIQRAFLFPTDVDTALLYYRDLGRILPLLPHITVAQTYAASQFRVLYQTVELGAYTISIYCDLQSEVDEAGPIIRVLPGTFDTPVIAETKFNSTTAYGQFFIFSEFFDLGDQTRIEYKLSLEAELPRPRGLQLMPRRILSRIGQGITSSRIREIADGFISSSLDAFPNWLAQQPIR